MCGIIYATSFAKKPVNKIILDRFQAQRLRGIEGFGVYDRQYSNLVRNVDEEPMLEWLKTHPSYDLLFHHRMPTSTANVKNACHPFSTGEFFDTNYILVHNGWLTNEDFLKIDHDNQGIQYTSLQPDGTYNDSEALLWEVANYLEGKTDRIRARGAVAFVCIARHPDGDKLYYYRNYGSPLKAYLSDNGMILSSEGAGEDVPAHELFEYNYQTNGTKFTHLIVDQSYTYPGADSLSNWRSSSSTIHSRPVYNDHDDEKHEQQTITGLSPEVKALPESVPTDSPLHYWWPMTKEAISACWPMLMKPDGTAEIAYSISYVKAVRKYYNRLLADHKGSYSAVLSAMEHDEERLLKLIAIVKKDKTIKKVTHQSNTCVIAQEMLLNHPYFKDDESVDPYYSDDYSGIFTGETTTVKGKEAVAA